MRYVCQFLWNIPAVVGASLVYALPQSNKNGRLIGFYMTNFSNASLPLLFSLMSSNLAGHTKRSAGNSILFLGYSTAFIIGPQFFLASEDPVYQTGFKIMIVTFGIAILAPLLLWPYLTWQNRLEEKKLMESGGRMYT